ncbi:Sucrose phosphorylase [compost metagenome]
MVNHISQQSSYFQDFLEKGRDSEYADLFLTLDKIWPNGEPLQQDIEKMFLRRPLPYSTFAIRSSGKEERVWTTFGKTDPSEQIDLDIGSEKTKELLTRFFENFQKNNIKIVRLDAVGYVIKKRGTSCFFVEPDIYSFLDWIMDMAKRMNIELLPEVHSHYSIQHKLAEHGFWIYDFILPYRVLEALINRSSEELSEYLKSRPHKQFTLLDCHDGIPVKPDMDGLIDTNEAKNLVNHCVERGANLSLIVSDEHKDEDGFDVHQIRCTFYDALDRNDDAYLAARAIQFFTPGVPQVYYVGLFAGENDYELANLTGEGRDINRHNYSLDEIELAVEKPIVQRLLKLIRFRNNHNAFNGKFSDITSQSDELRLSWQHETTSCELHVNLKNYNTTIFYVNETGSTELFIV